MKRIFRTIIGMMLLSIPLCVSAQDVNKKVDDLQGKIDRMPKISGFVQGLYQANLTEEGELKDNTFRMRRVRMSVEGNLAKGLTYKIQGDFSRSPMLVDAFVKYKVCNEFAIQVGQFKTPFSIESPINPVNLEIFDYGESVQKLVGYSDVCGVGSIGRDLGIMATGSLFPVELQNGQQFGLIDYSVGVFNGNGANEKDNNNRKDIVGRLDFHPWVKALTLSGSYYHGNYYKDEDFNGVRNRWAAGLQYNDGKFLVRAEYLEGTTGYHGFEGEDAPNQFNSAGYYAVAGYNFQFGKEGKEQKLMPVLRYEHFEQQVGVFQIHTADHVIYFLPNVSAPTSYYTAGINYWPLKNLNFKVDYSLIDGLKKVEGQYQKNHSHRVVGMVNYKF
ncbi:MAG: hypothetical protein IKZ55_02005 [Bacteroidales bacterium]|nr:hypothetical protein [Bacteroidales bacterium]